MGFDTGVLVGGLVGNKPYSPTIVRIRVLCAILSSSYLV